MNSSVSTSRWSALLLVCSLFLLPWSVLSYGAPTEGSTTLVFAWGLFNPGTGQLTGLHTFLAYTRGLPDWLLAWPVGVAALVAALASAAVGVARGRGGDGRKASTERVTTALLVLVGIAALSLSWGFSAQPGRTGWPVGTVVAWAVAGWLRLRTDR